MAGQKNVPDAKQKQVHPSIAYVLAWCRIFHPSPSDNGREAEGWKMLCLKKKELPEILVTIGLWNDPDLNPVPGVLPRMTHVRVNGGVLRISFHGDARMRAIPNRGLSQRQQLAEFPIVPKLTPKKYEKKFNPLVDKPVLIDG